VRDWAFRAITDSLAVARGISDSLCPGAPIYSSSGSTHNGTLMPILVVPPELRECYDAGIPPMLQAIKCRSEELDPEEDIRR
jgi:hypothetical protein